MEYHRLYQMMDYQARCEAEMDFERTGWCKCECWMYERDEDMEFVDWKFTCKVCGQKTARMVYPPEGILRWSNNKVFCPICGVWTKPLDHELERHINETTPFSLDHFRGTK